MSETFSTKRKRNLTPTGASRLLAKAERAKQHEAKGEGGGMGDREARRQRMGLDREEAKQAVSEALGLE